MSNPETLEVLLERYHRYRSYHCGGKKMDSLKKRIVIQLYVRGIYG